MRELRIAVLGNVDAGKSSLTGVLTKRVLDDGRGYARSLVSQFTHERETGKTSSVTQNFSKDDGGNVVVYIDLAGHEKYLKTTLHGMTGFFPDYGMVVVGGNMGITDITKEHINVAIALNVPFMIVITKVDIAPAHVLERTKKHIEEIIRERLKRKTAIDMMEMSKQGTGERVENFETLTQLRRWIPIFTVSNKTGEGIDLLRRYIHHVQGFFETHNKLTVPFHIHDDMKDCSVFSVDRSYQVNGVGTVLSGQVCNGGFKRNDMAYLGPFHGVWHPVTVRSFHDNFRTGIEKIDMGESGCIAIKCLAKGVDMKKLAFRKGIYLMSSEKCKKYTAYDFEAEVFIMHTHSTSISRNYQPVINCNKIVQAAKIIDIRPMEVSVAESSEKPSSSQPQPQSDPVPVPYKRPTTGTIRAGDRCRIRFRFNHRPEFIQENDRFIFREGQTRGIGVIRKVISSLLDHTLTSVFSVGTA